MECEYDTVLCSDVLYHSNLFEPLAQTVTWLLERPVRGGDKGQKPLLVLAREQRNCNVEPFFDMLRAAGVELEEVAIEEMDPEYAVPELHIHVGRMRT